MTSGVAVSVRGVGKRYRRQSPSERHDSLRDAVVAGVSGIFSSSAARAEQRERNTFWALKGATFDIEKGENVGIIGLNGAGKSTLLKMLSRITTPTAGEIDITGRLGALLEVGTGFHHELTGRENVFLYGAILGMSRKEISSKFDAIVDFAEISEFIDTPVKRYSSGMYVRLAFAVAAHLDPDILLLDEVLAVGDFAFQRKCINFTRQLQRRGATILFVSHNMFSIKTMCQRVIYLSKGRVLFDGPTDEGLKLYENDSKLKTASWLKEPSQNPPIVFTDAKLLNSQGAEVAVFDHGEPMIVRLAYKAFRRIERPDIRILIDRSDDLTCSLFSTFADEAPIPYLEGDGVIELRTPPILLTSDLYNYQVVVRSGERGDVLTAQVGGGFHVRHPFLTTLGYGVFHERGEWRIAGNEARAGIAIEALDQHASRLHQK